LALKSVEEKYQKELGQVEEKYQKEIAELEVFIFETKSPYN
jgi:hypothetical protein